MEQSTHKLIARNTLFLYARMLLITVVSLYTSRVVLNTLGAEDYGIYGLVGGIVAMFSFLNSAMSGATSRFLAFEMGRGTTDKLRDTFSSALIAHIIIALLIAVLVSTIGLWFLWNKLVIPDGRMGAANIVLITSVISMFITVTQVPYNSAIIAHEKMDVYAYVELLNAALKLLIVYLLVIGDLDKLILYAILQLAVSFIIAMIYRIYCHKHFEESHFHWVWDKTILKPMLLFSGWDLFGNMSVSVRQQGTNFLINMFFGVIYNAASSVASTVQGTILGLSHNVLTAFRPQIIKQYSAGNYPESVNLIYQAAKFSTILLVLVAIPFFFEMDFIMELWLVNPPEMASTFCRIMLISGCINMCDCSVNIGIHASGRMKTMSVLTGLCYLGVLPIIWICYHYGLPIESAYYLGIIVCICSLTIKAILVHCYIPAFSIPHLVSNSILPIIIVSVVTFLSVLPVYLILEEGVIRCLLVFLIDAIIGIFITFLFALNKSQRQRILAFAQSKIKKVTQP